jgi:hypothetical protein
MRCALVLAATLLAQPALAQPDAAPQPVPAPAPTDAPPTPPASTEPAPPRVDPAYGEQPDERVDDPSRNDMPGVRRGRDIVVRYTPSRSRNNVILLAALGGAAVIAGSIGAYFHLQYNSDNSDVAADSYTGLPWSTQRQDVYDRAQRESVYAGIGYGIGAGLLLATAIAYIVTEPDPVEEVISPHTNAKHALVAPMPGGALVGGVWSF